MALELIKISEFPQVSEPGDWIVVSDASGTGYKISKEDFKEWLGTVTVITDKPIALADPAPTMDGVYLPTEAGTYTNAGGLVYDPEGVDAGKYVQFIKNDTAWTKLAVDLPQAAANGEVEPNDTKAPSGDKVYKSQEPFRQNMRLVYGLVTQSINILDRSEALNQAWGTNGEAGSSAANWVRIGMMPIKPSTQYHYQGNGSIGSGTPLMVFFDISGNHIPEDNILSTGGSNQDVDFTTSANAYFVGANVQNLIGAGDNPTTAPALNTIMISEGFGNKPFQPYSIGIDGDKISGVINTPQMTSFQNGINQNSALANSVNANLASVTVASKNMFNRYEVVTGRWRPTGTNDGSVNWLSTPKIDCESSTQYTISGFQSFSSANSRVSFFDASGALISTIPSVSGSTAPVTFVTPSNCTSFAVNILNRVNAGGSNAQLQPEMETFQIEKGSSATAYEPFGLMLDGSKLTNIPEFNKDEVILVREGSTVLRLYFHGGKDADNDIYFRVRFVRQNSPSKFILLWRMDEADIARRTGDTTFEVVQPIVSTGVWENAIYTTTGGYDDALGSAHGWEMMEDVTFFMDNEVIDVTVPGSTWKGKEFKVVQSTSLKTADGSGDVAKTAKQWSFTANKIVVPITIKWSQTLGIDIGSFLGMLAILRKEGENQITHTGYSNEEFVKYDISEPGFTNPLYTNNSDKSRSSIAVWGDRVYAEMSVDRAQIFDNGGMYVQNTTLYNKLYSRLGSTTVQPGDVWRVVVTYNINVK